MIKIKAYHGTKDRIGEEFKHFPVWFSNSEQYADFFSGVWHPDMKKDENSRVIACELTLMRPAYTDDWCITEPSSHEAAEKLMRDTISNGYDSIIFTAPDAENEIEYIVFKSDQIAQTSA